MLLLLFSLDFRFLVVGGDTIGAVAGIESPFFETAFNSPGASGFPVSIYPTGTDAGCGTAVILLISRSRRTSDPLWARLCCLRYSNSSRSRIEFISTGIVLP